MSMRKRKATAFVCSVALVLSMGLTACGQQEETADVTDDGAVEEVVSDDSDDVSETEDDQQYTDESQEQSDDYETEAEVVEETTEEEEVEKDVDIKLSDAVVTVPKGWTILKDDSPRQLIIQESAGGGKIEFWCGEQHAKEALSGVKYDIYTWTVGDVTYKGYDRSTRESVLVTGSLTMNIDNIYEQELKKFLEYNIHI